MSYTKQTWENTPSTASPITANALNHMEQGIYDANLTATTSRDGQMSSADKTKLNGISSGAKSVSISVDGEDMTISVS